MASIRSALVTGAAVLAAAGGGATIAAAASSSGSSSGSGSSSDQHGPHTVNGKAEQPLTGSTEASVRKAALAKVPGTVDRVETNVDGSAPYEAHIVKADGTEVEVQISKDFTVAAVNSMGDHGGDHDGPGQP